MLEYFEIKDNFIYVKQDLLVDPKESEFGSSLCFTPLLLETSQVFNSTGKLIKETSEHGIMILRYLSDNQPIMFRNTYLNEEVDNFKFKFCCEEEKKCYLYNNKPIIQIIENVDNLFKGNDIDFSNLNPFFMVEDNGFGRDIRITTPIKLKPKQYYEIKSGIKVHSKDKYLFLARYFWKYGLVIQPSLEITEDNNVLFKLYNAENTEVILGEADDYNLLYNIFKLKE